MKKFQKYCLCPLFLCSFQNPVIQDVASEYRKLYTCEDLLQIKKTSSVKQSNETFESFSKYTLFEQILKIIDSSKYSEVIKKNNVIEPKIYEELSFFSGSLVRPKEILVEKLNKTKTLSGEVVLSLLLANPTNDVKVLEARKAFLQFLVQNKDVYEKLCEILKFFKKVETSVVSLYSYGDFLYSSYFYDKLFENFYFSKNNWRAGKLELKKRVTKNFFGVELPIFYRFILPLSYTITQPPIWRVSVYKKYTWLSAIPIFSFFYKTFFFNSKEFLDYNSDPKVNNFFSYTERIFEELLFIKMLFTAIDNYQKCNQQINTLFKRMDDVRGMVKVIKVLKNFSDNTNLPVLRQMTKFINSFFGNAKNDLKMRKMLQYLEKLPPKSVSFFFNNTGNILACFDLFGDVIRNFNEIFYEIGLIDAYVSMATLILENKDKKNCFCFCEFLANENEPNLQIMGLWNPFIDPKIAVGNDVWLNYDKEKTIIITGPNAGGKSSFIKGILYNALLAQTFGIGIAKKLSFTPFSKIAAYLNSGDKISSDNGKSLFVSSVLDTRDFMKGLDDKHFSLCVFDEIFSGTDPQISEALEFSTVEYLNDKYKNNLTVLSTHKSLVTTLDKKRNVKNYRVYITRDPNDNIVYNYKIIKGVSTQRIGIDILRQNGYKDEIIYKASKICKRNS